MSQPCKSPNTISYLGGSSKIETAVHQTSDACHWCPVDVLVHPVDVFELQFVHDVVQERHPCRLGVRGMKTHRNFDLKEARRENGRSIGRQYYSACTETECKGTSGWFCEVYAGAENASTAVFRLSTPTVDLPDRVARRQEHAKCWWQSWLIGPENMQRQQPPQQQPLPQQQDTCTDLSPSLKIVIEISSYVMCVRHVRACWLDLHSPYASICTGPGNARTGLCFSQGACDDHRPSTVASSSYCSALCGRMHAA